MTDQDEKKAEGDGDAEPAAPDAPAPAPKKKRKKKKAAKKAKSVAAPTPDSATMSPDEAGEDAKDEDKRELPKWNRKRVKRKSGGKDEDDALQATVRKAGQVTLARAPVIIGGLLALAGVIAGILWYQGKAEEDNAIATRMLSTAAGFGARGLVVDPSELPEDLPDRPLPVPIASTEEERQQKIDEALGQLQADASGSKAARLGGLVRAGTLMRRGQFGEAKTAYEEFLAQVGDGHMLSFIAQEGIGLALEGGGDVDGALEQFDKLAGEKEAFYRDQALWQKGRLLEAADRGDEALEVYKQYVEEFPLTEDSMAKAQVMGRLGELAPELIPRGGQDGREGAMQQGLQGLQGLGIGP